MTNALWLIKTMVKDVKWWKCLDAMVSERGLRRCQAVDQKVKSDPEEMVQFNVEQACSTSGGAAQLCPGLLKKLIFLKENNEVRSFSEETIKVSVWGEFTGKRSFLPRSSRPRGPENHGDNPAVWSVKAERELSDHKPANSSC